MPINLIKRLIVSTAGSFVAIVAAAGLAGYLFDVPNLTDWRGTTPMALPSAFSFLLIGAALLTIATDFSAWKST